MKYYYVYLFLLSTIALSNSSIKAQQTNSIIDESAMKLPETKETQALIDAARKFCIDSKEKMQATENHNPIVENKINVLNSLIEDCNSKFNMLNLDFNSKIERLIATLFNKE